MKRIKMIMPVPMPQAALAAFEAQIPPALRRSDVTVDFVAVKEGGKILDSYYEMTLADAFVLEAGASAEAEGYDAVCINSMSDSGLAALRSRLSIPVVGPGQSCLLTACMLGEKFSVLTMWDQWRPLYKKAIQEQGLMHRVASVRSIDVRPDAQELLAGKEEIVFAKLEAEGLAAIEQLIGDSGYCVGHEPGLADVYVIPQLYAAERFNVSLAAYPRIARVAALAKQHPAFITAHPANQPDTH